MSNPYAMMLAAVLVSCSAFGCDSVPAKVTGGGAIQSVSGPGRPSFGFTASSCNGPVKGQFTYHDKDAPRFSANGGLSMSGDVIEAGSCDPSQAIVMPPSACERCTAICGGSPNLYAIMVGYQSTNPKIPGSGLAYACVVDNGEGSGSDGDSGTIDVYSGPYAGHFDWGPVEGNIQSHACD